MNRVVHEFLKYYYRPDDGTAIIRAVFNRDERSQLRRIHNETGKSHSTQ